MKEVKTLRERHIQAEIDERSEKLGYKIREAHMEKVPYMVILGEKEMENRTVSVRQRDAERGQQEMGEMSAEEFVKFLAL